MINKIVKLLKENSEVTAYKVIENKSESVELFYVTDKLETNRVTDIKSYSVTVYHDFESFRGSSSFEVSLSHSDEEIVSAISKAVTRSKFAKNKFYELPKASDEALTEIPAPILNYSFKEVACKVADAIFKANVYKQGWINSCEIFVTKSQTTIVNSNGVDLTSTQANLYVEIIPTWAGEKEEVELYEILHTSSINYDEITQKIDEVMLNAKARAEAVQLPKELTNCNVIFQGGETAQFFNFFKSQLDYYNVYMHMNLFNVGDSVNDTTDADPIDITLKPYVEGAASAMSFDNDGCVLTPCHIIENSVCKQKHGNFGYGYYLKEEHPTGTYSNMEVKAGSQSIEEMKKEPHILCVYFSGLQVDGYSGYYGGEVRLGFYFDGEKYTPVTGFSIAGNLHQDKNHFRYSKELQTVRGYRGPKYLLAKNVKII